MTLPPIKLYTLNAEGIVNNIIKRRLYCAGCGADVTDLDEEKDEVEFIAVHEHGGSVMVRLCSECYDTLRKAGVRSVSVC